VRISRKSGIFVSLGACCLALFILGFLSLRFTKTEIQKSPTFSKNQLEESLGELLLHNNWPTHFPITDSQSANGIPNLAQVRYTLNQDSQNHVDNLFKQYKPDYGAFVAISADTGRVLTLSSFQKNANEKNLGNLALRSMFPAASIFKVITAAAAIDNSNLNPDSIFAFNGSSHTLYKRNVAQTQYNRWTRYMTMREAFAKSVNTVFGKMGAHYIGPHGLEEYAKRFGFDRDIESDLPVETGAAFKPEEGNHFEIAEAASGFNRESKMSPLQGAMIAAGIINDGVIMEPFVVESLWSTELSKAIYTGEPKTLSVAIQPNSAKQMRELMRETVVRGTSRKSFRQVFRRKDLLDLLELGGKTGSLTANYPRAKVDWFIGYASYKGEKIAVAALTAHKEYWTVKSSYLAASYFDHYYRNTFADIPKENLIKIARKSKRSIASKKQRSRRK